MIVGNLFQQAYTIVDSAIVGHYNGEAALAAVGASSALTTIFICVAIGGGIGASVIISQHFGAKRFARMKSAVYTALLTFLAVSVLLAGVGLLCSEQIMTALKTPPDALEIAVTYLNIYFYGLPFLFLYNILSSLFNALGKSRIPLYFLIFSSLLNVVLDWYFVAVLHRGVPGAAYATFLAQGLSAVLSFGVFLLELRRIPERSNGLFRFGELRAMTRVALPSILQQSTVSIGMMLVQSVVNGFGTQILAGFSAAARIESLCIVPMAAISNALSSYTAQNIGAEKPERVPQGYRAANRMIVLISVLLCVLLELFRTPIIAMFLDAAPSPETVATGEHYLQFIGFFFCFIGFKMAVDGILRGAGDVKMFTIANLVNLAIRVLLSWLCAPLWGVEIVWYAVPAGWQTLSSPSHITAPESGRKNESHKKSAPSCSRTARIFIYFQSSVPLGATPMAYSTAMATSTTSSEMIKPCSMGFRPALRMSEKLVFRPMAANAVTMRNLLISLSTEATEAGMYPRLFTPHRARKPRMNHGKTDFILTLTADGSPAASFFFTCMTMRAKISTVGMIASVRVSFTIVAKSPACSLKA